MAFYGDVGETFGVLGVIASVMGGCLWFDGNSQARAWGEVAIQMFYILLVSLFLIRVAQIIRRERTEKHA